MTARFPATAFVIAALVFACGAREAPGQTYPDRSPAMVVTFAAGGSSDVLARAVAAAMSQGLGKPIIVENRPGAGAARSARGSAADWRATTG